jgi:hypothetical protein
MRRCSLPPMLETLGCLALGFRNSRVILQSQIQDEVDYQPELYSSRNQGPRFVLLGMQIPLCEAES